MWNNLAGREVGRREEAKERGTKRRGRRSRSLRKGCVTEHGGLTRKCRDPKAPATCESQGTNLCVLEPAVHH